MNEPAVSINETEAIPAPLFQNEHYSIHTMRNKRPIKMQDTEYFSWYEVINAQSGVVEAKTICYPEALHLADAYNTALLNETWKPMDERATEDGPKLTVVPKLN